MQRENLGGGKPVGIPGAQVHGHMGTSTFGRLPFLGASVDVGKWTPPKRMTAKERHRHHFLGPQAPSSHAPHLLRLEAVAHQVPAKADAELHLNAHRVVLVSRNLNRKPLLGKGVLHVVSLAAGFRGKSKQAGGK